jgi:hypothetical protein
MTIEYSLKGVFFDVSDVLLAQMDFVESQSHKHSLAFVVVFGTLLILPTTIAWEFTRMVPHNNNLG